MFDISRQMNAKWSTQNDLSLSIQHLKNDTDGKAENHVVVVRYRLDTICL